MLWKAGVHFCIITDHPIIPIEHLPSASALAVRGGLPSEEALKGVTIYAEHLGIAGRMGSIEREGRRYRPVGRRLRTPGAGR
ncbi:hypothetical protein MASR2M17_18530 [Aminivibrio sp.]